MKLIVAIVQDQDVNALMDALTEKKYRVTKLSSTGGFLKSGNTTLLIGVEDDKVNEVKELVDHNCKTREITTSLLTVTMPGDTFVPYPLEVKVGGATLFVLNVEEFLRV
ncbi:MAG: cyclic-di-AMP receptor [Eubacteriales bacterium]|uniref:cyclic-di-AMP receptor n=1 Tax=Fenollaria TaxID=1686313 RepID=UPI00071C4493|nr:MULTISPECIES: cyclic-di-AMP receptor [Fenollaria]MDD7339475.1 cyclic-di-AMP receptor [Eubacteriales bacterium]MDY3105308.1 cyclic-di-AMP receptor [Fenollaria sp.]